MNPPERKQLLAVMADRLELDALDFIPSWTIYFYHLPTHLWVLGNGLDSVLEESLEKIKKTRPKGE